jgi:hypothetical protein
MEETIKFYYMRDMFGEPRVTVCLIRLESECRYARGVAICSELDNFSKKIGRAIAEGRARAVLNLPLINLKAIGCYATRPVIRVEAENILFYVGADTNGEFELKATTFMDPSYLTDYELTLYIKKEKSE